ncbi:MAG: divergent PAP2 family protein [Erysipelotrichaceae bacterium]|nr:divergent PAP2 family protein [Erysipelotrichaceae bacterium]
MLSYMYPFWAALIAMISAQFAKPFYLWLLKREWNWSLMKASGGFPSSHSATVAALSLAVGIQENFSSTIFAVTLAFSMIICYDAANVRYYAGQNIQITRQLIKDIQELTATKLTDPIYLTKIKNVLGHTWVEVIGGVCHGLIVAGILYFLK